MEATVVGKALRVKITGGVLEHLESGQSIPIDADVTRRVGRGESCHLRLSDRHVSTAHCELIGTERGVVLRDLGSTNGTRLNDVLLGPNQFALLTRPTKIKVGGAELLFTPKKEEREVVGSFGGFESRSTRMSLINDRSVLIAKMSGHVHLTGETGTGKTRMALEIHNRSARASGPFMVIDCAAIVASLAVAELFGYEKGAFTGATGAKKSPFVECKGGTIFLDEIGDLPPEVQPHLLRVADEQVVKSLGQNQYQKVDVRIISATKHNLAARVNAGFFRDDLYSRLTAAQIELPPLRERSEDVEPLIEGILAELGRPELFALIPPEKLTFLRTRLWSGNVRQLRHVVINLADLTRDDTSDVGKAVDTAYAFGPAEAILPAASGAKDDEEFPATMAEARAQAETAFLTRLHRETNGNLTALAERAQISRLLARQLLEKYGIRQREPRRGGKT